MGQNEAHGPKPSTKYTRSNYQVYQTQVWKYTEVKFQIKFLGYYSYASFGFFLGLRENQMWRWGDSGFFWL